MTKSMEINRPERKHLPNFPKCSILNIYCIDRPIAPLLSHMFPILDFISLGASLLFHNSLSESLGYGEVGTSP